MPRDRSHDALRVALFAALWFFLSVRSVRAHGDRITLKIPFAFSAGDTALPAGDYQLESLGRGITRLSGLDKEISAVFSTVEVTSPSGESAAAKLIFNRYDKDYFLSEICWGEVHSKVVPSKKERQLAKTATPTRIVTPPR